MSGQAFEINTGLIRQYTSKVMASCAKPGRASTSSYLVVDAFDSGAKLPRYSKDYLIADIHDSDIEYRLGDALQMALRY
jgi:hypothetical protein